MRTRQYQVRLGGVHWPDGDRLLHCDLVITTVFGPDQGPDIRMTSCCRLLLTLALHAVIHDAYKPTSWHIVLAHTRL